MNTYIDETCLHFFFIFFVVVMACMINDCAINNCMLTSTLFICGGQHDVFQVVGDYAVVNFKHYDAEFVIINISAKCPGKRTIIL